MHPVPVVPVRRNKVSAQFLRLSVSRNVHSSLPRLSPNSVPRSRVLSVHLSRVPSVPHNKVLSALRSKGSVLSRVLSRSNAPSNKASALVANNKSQAPIAWLL